MNSSIEPTGPDALLTVQGVSKTYSIGGRSVAAVGGRQKQRLVALDDVSMAIAGHEIVAVVGESGSGKSTLAKCLVRLIEADRGSIQLHSQEVRDLRGRDLANVRRTMQMIYQDPYSSLNPLMTIGDAIAEPALYHGLIEKDARDEYVKSALDVVGMAGALADRRPRALSGGQRQRAAIARAMATEPELLIADEAVSALDVSVQAQILRLFAKLRDERGVAIIFIAHDLSIVASIADRVHVMYLGAVMESGPTREVFTAPGHPYTAALLKAQPGRHRRHQAATPVLRGEIPSAVGAPAACRFSSRCPLAQDICREVDPPAVDLGGGRIARCHFASDVVSAPDQLDRGNVIP